MICPRGEQVRCPRRKRLSVRSSAFRENLGRPRGQVLQKLVDSVAARANRFTRGPLQGQLVHGFKTRPLKGNVQEEIQALEPDMLRAIMGNAIERARACKAENSHFCCIIFHKSTNNGSPRRKDLDKCSQKEEEERTARERGDTSRPWEKDSRVSFL